MDASKLHPDTLALHAGFRSDPATTAVAVPIYQTTSYQFRDTDHASKRNSCGGSHAAEISVSGAGPLSPLGGSSPAMR